MGAASIVDTRQRTLPLLIIGGQALPCAACAAGCFRSVALRWNRQTTPLLAPDEKLGRQDYDPIQTQGLGVTLGRDELAGKTVMLEIREDPQERPSVRRRWIETPTGWKPCQGHRGLRALPKSRPYSDFQMNGQNALSTQL